MPVKHIFQSGRLDNADIGAIQPSHWNDDHKLEGLLELIDVVTPTPNTIFSLDGTNQPALIPKSSLVLSDSPAFSGVPTAPTAATPTSFAAPEISSTMLFGTGASGDKSAASVKVEGTLEGQADVKIKIEAPELIKAYYEAINAMKIVGQIGPNGPGSTGRSSPDTQAPSGTGFSGVW